MRQHPSRSTAIRCKGAVAGAQSGGSRRPKQIHRDPAWDPAAGAQSGGEPAPYAAPLPPNVGSSGWREPAPEQICCDPSWDPAATGTHGPRRRRGGCGVAERDRTAAGPRSGPAVPAGLRGSPRPGARCPPSPAASPSPPCAPAPTPPAPAAAPSPSSGTRSPCGGQSVGARHPPHPPTQHQGDPGEVGKVGGDPGTRVSGRDSAQRGGDARGSPRGRSLPRGWSVARDEGCPGGSWCPRDGSTSRGRSLPEGRSLPRG